MRTVYIVGHNMPGYLPDSDPYIVSSKRDAIRASREDAERSMEDSYDIDEPEYHETLSGSRGDYWVSAPAGPTYHYWVSPASAELRDVASDPEGAYHWERRSRCECCERELSGERAYYVSDSECYVCRDCIGGGR